MFDAKNSWKLHRSIHGIDKHIVLDTFDDATPISAKKWKKLLQGEDISNWGLVTWHYNSKEDDVDAVKLDGSTKSRIGQRVLVLRISKEYHIMTTTAIQKFAEEQITKQNGGIV